MEETHGVDVEHVDVRGRHEEVLDERRDHMPWFKLFVTQRKENSILARAKHW